MSYDTTTINIVNAWLNKFKDTPELFKQHKDTVNAMAKGSVTADKILDYVTAHPHLSPEKLPNLVTDVTVSPDPDSAGFWKNRTDSELAQAAYRDPRFSDINKDGQINTTVLERYKNILEGKTDSIVNRRKTDAEDGFLWRTLFPHRTEDKYAGREPSLKSTLLDGAFILADAAPFMIPGGVAARGVAGVGRALAPKVGKFIGEKVIPVASKAIGKGVEYVIGNGAAPVIEEAVDAASYDVDENADRSDFNWGDVLRGTVTNIGTPYLLKAAAAPFAALTGTKGAVKSVLNLGADPATSSLAKRDEYLAALDAFEKNSRSSGTNIRELNDVNKIVGKPDYDDPLKTLEKDGYFYVNESTPNIDPRITTPSIPEAQDLKRKVDLLESFGANSDKYMLTEDFQVMGPKTLNHEMTDIPYYPFNEDMTNAYRALLVDGAYPTPSLAKRLGVTMPYSLVTNRLNKGDPDKALDRIDLTTIIPGVGENGLVENFVKDLDASHKERVREAQTKAENKKKQDLQSKKEKWSVGYAIPMPYEEDYDEYLKFKDERTRRMMGVI